MPKQDNTYEKKIMLMRRKMTRLGAMLLFLAAALSSCTRELPYGAADSPLNDKDIHMVPLWIEGQGADTKVAVNDGSGKCSWLKGDAIAMYITGSGANTYSNLTVDHTENCVRVGLPGNQEIGFYSIYPAGARVDSHYGNTELRVKYGNEYMLPKMGADSLNLWSPLPMVAANTENGSALNSISFYHVGGLLRLVLTNYSKSDVTAIRVTLEGMKKVTGVFTVNNPATLAADVTFQSGVDSDQNVITYTIPTGHNSKLPDELWINVPLPTGDYTTLSGVKVDAVSASAPRSITRKVQWSKIRHGQGKHIQMDLSGAAGALSYVAVGSTDDVTLWAGETLVRRAIAYDAADIAIPSAAITWASSNPSVAQVQNNGTLTAMAAGTTLITATATAGGVTKTESFTLHVNEIRGISVNKSSLYVRKGRPATLRVTLDYTTNGNYVVPQLGWTSSNTSVASVQKTLTASGEVNDINGLALGKTLITAAVPAGRYGSANHSISIPVTVLGSNYIPGPFSVSDTKQVFFSSGNLVVTYNSDTDIDWAFESEQYVIPDVNNIPPYSPGMRVSLFSWGSGNDPFFHPSLNTRYSARDYLSLFSEFHDWGVHFNDEGEGDNSRTDGTWYTLSVEEFNYLRFQRNRASLLQCKANIVDPNSGQLYSGTILLPDNWELPETCDFSFDRTCSYVINTSIAQYDGLWQDMENAGAVFIPLIDLVSFFYIPNSDGDYLESVLVQNYSRVFSQDNYYWARGANITLPTELGYYWTIDYYYWRRGLFVDGHLNDLYAVRLVHD